MPRSYGKRKAVIVYLAQGDYQQIEKMAAQQRLSISAMARTLLARQLAALAQSSDPT